MSGGSPRSMRAERVFGRFWRRSLAPLHRDGKARKVLDSRPSKPPTAQEGACQRRSQPLRRPTTGRPRSCSPTSRSTPPPSPTPASRSRRRGCRSCRDGPRPRRSARSSAARRGRRHRPARSRCPTRPTDARPWPRLVPQSMRQQQLVCLSSGHVNCPRYQHGAVAMTPVPVARPRALTTLTPAIAISLATLVLSFIDLGRVRGGERWIDRALGGGRQQAARRVAVPGGSRDIGCRGRDHRAVGRGPGRDAEPDRSEPHAHRHAIADPDRLAHAEAHTQADTEAHPEAVIGPVRAADGVRRHVRLLDLPRSARATTSSSIANYFGVSLQRVRTMNPWTEDDRSQVRPAAADPDADPLTGNEGGAGCGRPRPTCHHSRPKVRMADPGRSMCLRRGPICRSVRAPTYPTSRR